MPDIKIETHLNEREIEVWINNIELLTDNELEIEVEEITDNHNFSVIEVRDFSSIDPENAFGHIFGERDDPKLWIFHTVAVAIDSMASSDREKAMACFFEYAQENFILSEKFHSDDIIKLFEEHYKGSYDSKGDYAENYVNELFEIPNMIKNHTDYESVAETLEDEHDMEFIYDAECGKFHAFSM